MVNILDKNLKNVVIDTCILIEHYNELQTLIDIRNVIINITTIEELDHLKSNKDPTVSYKARNAIKTVKKYSDKITFDFKKTIYKDLYYEDNQFNTNDNIIISCAKRNKSDFITDDYNAEIKAKSIGVNTISIFKKFHRYNGFRICTLSDEQLSEFYTNPDRNILNCYINEYAVIVDKDENVIDVKKWNGQQYVGLYNKKIKSSFFGDKFKAKDIYQSMAIDSIMTNTLTAISGHGGSGKSLISLVCAMHLIDKGEYDRLTILFNPTKTKGATDMGYYTGDQLEKALQSNIGNMLYSKFVDKSILLEMIKNDKIRLISMADARGMEVSDNDILYITECQNTNVDLIKLSLSRASENCKIIIEGDYDSQVDNNYFENENNGLVRVIDKLKNEDIFGYVDLQNIYRSKIAELIDKL